MTHERRRVIVFGLSADPPTGEEGHAGLVRFAATRADEVWVIPVYRHVFAEKRGMTPYAHRRAMAELAFEALPGLEGRVRVLDTERELVERSPTDRIGTIDLMRQLIADHPDTEFTLLLGADTYRDLLAGRWKEGEALRASVSIIPVAREGVPAPEGATVVPGISDVSSSEVRRSTDAGFLARVLDPRVLAYIRAHRLYAIGAVSSDPVR